MKTHRIKSRKGRSDTTSDVKTCKKVWIIVVERVVAWSQHLYERKCLKNVEIKRGKNS